VSLGLYQVMMNFLIVNGRRESLDKGFDMANATQVRVIFYDNSTMAFWEANGLPNMGSTSREACQKILAAGEQLLRQGLSEVFKDQTVTLDLVEAAMKLSSSSGLRSLAGKTILIVNPTEYGVRTFLGGYVAPENDPPEVQFYKGSLDPELKLVLESIALTKSKADNS
jgi:hypothetical protein